MSGVADQMTYRSLDFPEGPINEDIVRRGAELGFNDLAFKTIEDTVGPINELSRRVREEGYLELADELDMTITVWAHEITDYDPSWGPLTVDNDELWDALRERYERMLTEGFPWMDYLSLTITETYCWITEPPLIRKLVETINGVCRANDVELIFRSFVWRPQEMEAMREALPTLPEDVIVMHKAHPDDWHYRSIDHPLIGNVGERTELIQQDLANEYARYNYTAGCFPDLLSRQFEHWVEQGVEGFSAWVGYLRFLEEDQSFNALDENGNPVEKTYTRDPADDDTIPLRMNSPPFGVDYVPRDVLGHPNESNLWILGYLAQGRSADEALEDYAEHYFGEDAAKPMAEALRRTGDVLQEGLYVDALAFGRLKWNGTSPADRGGTPAHMTMNSRFQSTVRAQRQSEEVAINRLHSNPFATRPARWRFDESYVPTYHKIRKGHPDVVDEKESAYADAMALADETLELVDSVADELPEGAYEYFRFKFEENRFHLEAMCEAQLAWLKASNRLYYGETEGVYYGEEFTTYGDEDVTRHLAAIEELVDRYDESRECEWRGDHYNLRRGRYIDLIRYLHEFRRYWDMDDYESLSD